MVECKAKAKALTEKSKTGDLEAIQQDFEKGIKKGAEQAHTVIEGIETDSIEFLNEHKDLEFNNNEIDTYIPIVVVREHYDRLGTKEYIHLIEDAYITPDVIDIYNFEILGDLFSPNGMQKYVVGQEQFILERMKR